MNIASLPMYDFPEIRKTLDELWVGFARHLKRQGFEKVPRTLVRNVPLAISNYRSTVRVIDKGEDGSTVEWSNEFSADGAPENQMIDAVSGIYQAGLDNLKKMFGG